MLTFALVFFAPARILKVDGDAFRLAAPAGWTLELKPNEYDGIPAVLAPQGGDWRTADRVMYTNHAPKDRLTLAAFVAREGKDYRHNTPRPASPSGRSCAPPMARPLPCWTSTLRTSPSTSAAPTSRFPGASRA